MLKVGTFVGRIAGVPIPDVGSLLENWWGSMLMTLEEVRDETVASVEEELGTEAAVALGSLFNTGQRFVDDTVGATRDLIEEAAGTSEEKRHQRKNLILERSAEALDGMIGEPRGNWRTRTGLEKVL